MKYMKRIAVTVALVVGMLSFRTIAVAQQCSVAVLDWQEAVVGSNEGKAQSAKFNARVMEWAQKLDSIKKEIQDASVQLNGQNGRNPSQAQIDELNRTIREKNNQLSQAATDAQKDVDAYRDSLLIPIKTSAMEIAKLVAAEKGTNSVVDSSPLAPPPSVPIPAGGIKCDITSEVRERMNAKFAAADPVK
jgi:Skp family chaperone for outer membrane proteins